MLKAFRVLKNENEPTVEGIDYPILINIDHISTLKPINIMFNDSIISGYWVRLSSGKKYKATRVPQELIDIFKDDSHLAPMLMNDQEFISTTVQ